MLANFELILAEISRDFVSKKRESFDNIKVAERTRSKLEPETGTV